MATRKFIVTIREDAAPDLDAGDIQQAVVDAWPSSTDLDHGNVDVELIEVVHGPKAPRPITFWQYELAYNVLDVV